MVCNDIFLSRDSPIKHFVIPNTILLYLSVVSSNKETEGWEPKKYVQTHISQINSQLNSNSSPLSEFLEQLEVKNLDEGRRIYQGDYELSLLKYYKTDQGQEYKLKFRLQIVLNGSTGLIIKVSEFFPDFDKYVRL